MSTAQTELVVTVEPTDLVREKCDRDRSGTETALVAALYSLPSGPVRMTFCGHHFDHLGNGWKSVQLAVHDHRQFGLFDTPKPTE